MNKKNSKGYQIGMKQGDVYEDEHGRLIMLTSNEFTKTHPACKEHFNIATCSQSIDKTLQSKESDNVFLLFSCRREYEYSSASLIMASERKEDLLAIVHEHKIVNTWTREEFGEEFYYCEKSSAYSFYYAILEVPFNKRHCELDKSII